MPGQQALDAQRTPAFAFDPRDLVLVTDKRDPLFDLRVFRPITREAVEDVAIRGVHTPIRVKRRGDESVVVMGRQRTKRAMVANHLGAGQSYTGSLKSVHDAISELGQDVEFVKRLTTFMGGRPIKITALA